MECTDKLNNKLTIGSAFALAETGYGGRGRYMNMYVITGFITKTQAGKPRKEPMVTTKSIKFKNGKYSIEKYLSLSHGSFKTQTLADHAICIDNILPKNFKEQCKLDSIK
jgi:hypothetical protein